MGALIDRVLEKRATKKCAKLGLGALAGVAGCAGQAAEGILAADECSKILLAVQVGCTSNGNPA